MVHTVLIEKQKLLKSHISFRLPIQFNMLTPMTILINQKKFQILTRSKLYSLMVIVLLEFYVN